MKITWDGKAGQRYYIEACYDLAAGVWLRITPDIEGAEKMEAQIPEGHDMAAFRVATYIP